MKHNGTFFITSFPKQPYPHLQRTFYLFKEKTFMTIDGVLYMIPIGPIRLYLCQNLLSKLILIALGSYTLPFIINALVHLDLYYDYHMQM